MLPNPPKRRPESNSALSIFAGSPESMGLSEIPETEVYERRRETKRYARSEGKLA
jgi:hypothetical protein